MGVLDLSGWREGRREDCRARPGLPALPTAESGHTEGTESEDTDEITKGVSVVREEVHVGSLLCPQEKKKPRHVATNEATGKPGDPDVGTSWLAS